MLALFILSSFGVTIYMISNTDQSDAREMLESDDWFS